MEDQSSPADSPTSPDSPARQGRPSGRQTAEVPESSSGRRANKPLPTASHHVAGWWMWGGIVFYASFVLVLIWPRLSENANPVWGALEFVGVTITKVGDVTTRNVAWATLILVILGIVVFVVSTAWTLRSDLRTLRKEELDIDWIHTHEDDAFEWVFEPADQREALYKHARHSEAFDERHLVTLVDERVHLLTEKQRDAAVRVSPDELRVLAESRTAKFGSTARFASGLLLLLAVLGTFSGVKAALPGLIEAAAASEKGISGEASIAEPLKSVADAFGANSLALVGAIALGLMAQGMASGRRNLLERLEHVSDRLYRYIHSTDSLDPMTAAVRELGSAARIMHETAESLKNIETGIAQLDGTFKGSFANLNASLVEITDQQERALNERTSASLRALEARVMEMSEVVADNTRNYQGIVERLGASAGESREAISQTKNAVAVLERSMSSLFELEKNADRMLKELEERILTLDRGSQEIATRLENMVATMREFGPVVTGLQSFLQDTTNRFNEQENRSTKARAAMAERFTEQENRSTKAWQAMTDILDRQLKAAMARTSGFSERGPVDVPRLRTSPMLAGMAQGIGIVGVLGVTYLVTYLLLRITGQV